MREIKREIDREKVREYTINELLKFWEVISKL